MNALVEWLEQDHRAIEALFDRAGGGGTLDLAAFDEARARLLRHIAIEEKIVFAEVARAAGRPLPHARRLRVEHAALTTLLVPVPDLSLLGEVKSLLAHHNDTEEGPDGVYRACADILGARWPDLLARARAYPPVKAAAHVDRPGLVRTAALALARANQTREPWEPSPVADPTRS